MTKHTCLPVVALLALAIPAIAQTTAIPLTPPAVLGAAKTLQFTATEFLGGVPKRVSVATLAQPNMAYVQDTDVVTKAVIMVYASDGKIQTEYLRSHGQYTKSIAPASIADMRTRALAISAIRDFYMQEIFAKYSLVNGSYVMPLPDFGGPRESEWLMLDPTSGLPRSIVIRPDKVGDAAQGTAKAEVARVEFTNWNLNVPVAGSRFTYAPPATAKLYIPPKRVTAKLLADGVQAPDFTANDKDGHPIKLSDYRGKTVVLDFWATWCGPCQVSLPHTTAVAKQYADKGVTVLAVNVWDKPDAFQAWLPKHPQYSPLTFVIDPSKDDAKGIATRLYGVSGIPTQYVIGKDGRVIKSIVGYDDGSTALEDALKAAGAG